MAGVNITYYTKNGEKTIKVVNLPKIWMDKPDVSFIVPLRVAGLVEDLADIENMDELIDDALNGYNYTKAMNNKYNRELNKYKKWYAGQFAFEEEEKVEIVVGLNIADKLRALPGNKFLDVSDLKNIKVVLSTKNKFAGSKSKLTSNNYKNFHSAICSIPNGMVRFAEDVRNAKNYFNIDLGTETDVCTVGSTIDVGVPVRSLKSNAKRQEELKEKKEREEQRELERQIEREKALITEEIIEENEEQQEDDNNEDDSNNENEQIEEIINNLNKNVQYMFTKNKQEIKLKKFGSSFTITVDNDVRKTEFIDVDKIAEYIHNLIVKGYNVVELGQKYKDFISSNAVFGGNYRDKKKENPKIEKESEDIPKKETMKEKMLRLRREKEKKEKEKKEQEEEEEEKEEEQESESDEPVVNKKNKKKPVKEKKIVKERPFRLVFNTIKNKKIDVSNIDKKGFGIKIVADKNYEGFYNSDTLPLISDNYKGYKQAIKLIDNGPVKHKRDLDKARLYFGLAYLDVSDVEADVNNLKIVKPKELNNTYFINDDTVSNNYKNMYYFYEHYHDMDNFNKEEALAFFQVEYIDNIKLMVDSVSSKKVIDVSDIMNEYHVEEIKRKELGNNLYVSINNPIASDNLVAFLYTTSILDDTNGYKALDVEQATLFYEGKYIDVSKDKIKVVDDDEVCDVCFIATKLRIVSDNYEHFYDYIVEKGYLDLLEDDIILAKEFFNISDSEES